MKTPSTSIAGIIFGFVLASVFWCAAPSFYVQAQQDAGNTGSRFVISAWSNRGLENNRHRPEHGAYIVNTEDGTVYSVEGTSSPKRLGTAR